MKKKQQNIKIIGNENRLLTIGIHLGEIFSKVS
jgi:hypothetical protein